MIVFRRRLRHAHRGTYGWRYRDEINFSTELALDKSTSRYFLGGCMDNLYRNDLNQLIKIYGAFFTQERCFLSNKTFNRLDFVYGAEQN